MAKAPDVDSAYAMSSPEEIKQLYRSWSQSYDVAFGEAQGYQLPREVAAAFGARSNAPDAAAFADLVVLAVKGTAASKALSLAGEDNHAGKPVIDATNPYQGGFTNLHVIKY